jgi:lysozyme family protein
VEIYIHSPEKVKIWLQRILGHEGGYWDDPVGGPTKWGISQRSYPTHNIITLTVDDAEYLYRRDYLAPLQADRFQDGVAYQLLDFAVNSGQPNAVRTIQKALGVVADGKIGPITRAAIAARSESDMVMIIIAARLLYMTSLSNWEANSRGWARRMAKNLIHATEDTE